MPIGEIKESRITCRWKLDKQNNSRSKLIGFYQENYLLVASMNMNADSMTGHHQMDNIRIKLTT